MLQVIDYLFNLFFFLVPYPVLWTRYLKTCYSHSIFKLGGMVKDHECQKMDSLGFIINQKKSGLVTTQVLLHLGRMIDTLEDWCILHWPEWTQQCKQCRAPEIDCSVGLSLHASDGAHGILPCPRPAMLVPPVTSVDRPGGSLRLEARSTHQLDPPQKSSVPGCSGILDRSLETSP